MVEPPIWKICRSNLIISPGVKIKNRKPPPISDSTWTPKSHKITFIFPQTHPIIHPKRQTPLKNAGKGRQTILSLCECENGLFVFLHWSTFPSIFSFPSGGWGKGYIKVSEPTVRSSGKSDFSNSALAFCRNWPRWQAPPESETPHEHAWWLWKVEGCKSQLGDGFWNGQKGGCFL